MRKVNEAQTPIGAYHRALRSGERADEGFAALTRKVQTGLAVLFGSSVSDALFRDLERAHDNSADARDEFIEALSDKQREIDSLKGRLARAHGALFGAANELHRRYTRARKPVPEAFSDVVEAAGAQWPHLYAPDDDRHVHDFDAGGACRNAACRQVSNEEQEPF